MKNIRYSLLLLLFLLGSSSCNKWLDLKPQDGIVRENFWKTKEQLRSAVVGCYTALLNQTFIQNIFLWGELRGDMVTTHGSGSFPTIQEVNFNDLDITSTNGLVNWASLYAIINNCNTVIEFGPTVLKNDDTLTETELNGYLAEAHAIRGWMYFYLLRVWGEVPLQLHASSSDSNIQQLAKSSQDEVYQQIVADLEFAAANAPSNYTTKAETKGRFTKYAVNALQADVYLWMEDYADCIAACDKVISSGRYGLITDGSQYFSSIFIDGNSNESLFEIQFDNQALNPWFNYLVNTNLRYKASDEVPGMYGLNSDPTSTAKDIRGENVSYRSDLVIWKHVGTTNPNTAVTSTTSSRHWIAYRYADILLMKAEALAWSKRGAEAKDLINQTRSRGQAISETADNPSDNDFQGISDYILKERAREFAFEGKRWFDLVRHAKRNNFARKDLLIDAVSKVAVLDKQLTITSKLKDPRSYYLPIAFSELQADKLLEQNPFYK